MTSRWRRSFAVAAAVAILVAVTAAAGISRASTQAQPVSDPASLVNPLIGTSRGVNTFPGPSMPFGMIQWSPDTYPSRPFGGGYEYNTSQITGFSLTHMATGCPAYNDVPILPTVGGIGSSPGSATGSFSHSGESVQAGYYAVTWAVSTILDSFPGS